MSAATGVHELGMQYSPSYRLAHSGITIDGTVPLDFKRYPFIPEIIDEHAPIISVIKGAQMGFTIACIMRALEEAKAGKFRGIGYFFPSESEVGDFAKARFGPMMTNNPGIWGKFVKDTDSASLKRIGNTFLYFRGMGQKGGGTANRGMSKQKSIPLDRLYLDERDEMDDGRVDAAIHRLDGSLDPEQFMLSTPTYPGYGVDLSYTLSDQRVWMWRCQHCAEWTCLETTYPDCIAEPTNKEAFYLCSHKKCGKKLDRVEGEWVARKPEITKNHRGYWVSQLSSPTKTAQDILTAAILAASTGRRREFENQNLARAYAEADEEITTQQLEALLIDEPKPLRHEGPCAMGVDPGKPHWYTVRVRISEEHSTTIARGRADSYEELSRIAKKYNVESGVMDKGYDPTAVQRFCDAHKGWYGCLYIGSKKGAPDWDHKAKTVKAGRTWLLDEAHSAIIDKRVSHYQKDEFWEQQFVPQMKNLMRATNENDRTGERTAQWIVTGGQKNDHLRHADAYCNLAVSKCGLARNIQRMAMRNKTQKGGGRKRSAMRL